MESLRKMRSATSPQTQLPLSGHNQVYNGYGAANNHLHRSASHLFYQAPNHHTAMSDASSVQNLVPSFGRLNLQSPSSFGASRRTSSHVSSRQSDFGGVPLNSGMPPGYVVNGPLVWTGPAVVQGHGTQGQQGVSNSHSIYQPVGSHFGYQGWPSQFMDQSPNGTSSWNSSRNTSSEVPALITPRRDSSSTNEDAIPGTPFTSYTAGYGGVQILDQQSPNSVFFGTPSPQSFGGKQMVPQTIPPEFLSILTREPAIPHAVPAPNSPTKTLDRALQNPNGITNVYIRGLQPDTTDEMLRAWADRFGDIVSSKSIIDHATGKCKGYGFVKYHNFKDAEICIRGFHFMGYEASFARESFYSVLKKLSDEQNTNLYVSNLPKDMNEHELAALFEPYTVCSSRILRNSEGVGRGVGFARFENREHCEQVIREFNNTPVCKADGEEHLVQIRYADTKDQKALKQQTTAARNFRTAEYESVTSGRMGILDVADRKGPADSSTDADFETYMANANAGGASSSAPRPHYMSPAEARFNPSNGSKLAGPFVSSGSDRTLVNVNLPDAKSCAGQEHDEPPKAATTPVKVSPELAADETASDGESVIE